MDQFLAITSYDSPNDLTGWEKIISKTQKSYNTSLLKDSISSHSFTCESVKLQQQGCNTCRNYIILFPDSITITDIRI